MTRNVRLGELLLGTAGRAVMRGLLRGKDEDVQARVEEIRQIASRFDEEPYSLTLPVPELDPVEGYTLWAGTYDGGGNPLIDLEEPIVRRILSDIKPGRALDICCGTGRHTSFLAEQGHETVGIDMTPAMLQRAVGTTDRALFVQGDACRLPFADASVDLVVCALALTHFEELGPPIGEFARVLRPGGHCVLSDLNPMMRSLGGGAFFAAADGTFGLVREHLHLHASYLATFQAVGLEVVECLEPLLGEQQVEMFGFSYREFPEATRMADEGLQFALIWHLVKE